MITIIPFAKGPFFSLNNTDFVVLLGLLVFIGILLYFKVPGLITGLLDARAAKIKAELDEAKALREEAQTILAEYERKQKDVVDQAASIVASAKAEAEAAAVEAKAALEATIERRLAAAGDQIASAEKSAVKEVRDTAASVAVEAAATVIKAKLDAEASAKLVDSAIKDVTSKLH